MTKKVGQFTVPSLAGVQMAAAQIATSTQSGAQSAGLVPALRQATVISNDGGNPPSCTVTFDGATNVAGIRFGFPQYPVAGDVVNCAAVAGNTWIINRLYGVNDGQVSRIVGGNTAGVTYFSTATPPLLLCMGNASVDFNGTAGAATTVIDSGMASVLGGLGSCMVTNNTAIPGVPVNISTNAFTIRYTSPVVVAAGARTGYFIVWGV